MGRSHGVVSVFFRNPRYTPFRLRRAAVQLPDTGCGTADVRSRFGLDRDAAVRSHGQAVRVYLGGRRPGADLYTIKALRSDGWVLVEVADENTHPINFIGELPTRWLNVGLAISIQEMRPHQ